ncbi:MAG: prephenate dehydratase [Chloroflexi bacterium]|nr:prephenate dehydratase [Chloroflexota bacterium]MQC18771.1 prephenate dehydratase [Chloroflexota bacterium]
MRISHLGPTGTYTEAAARRFDADADLLPVATVPAAIQAVLDGGVDAAVCAMENSIEGSVSIETMDILIGPEFELRICGEVVLSIQHHMVGAPGINPAQAGVVYSHPQGLAQCRQSLHQLAPQAKPVAALSTAGAVEATMHEPGSLAVGSEYAAELYGATIYARDIGDERGNETRFVVLAREDADPTGDDKTSLAFTTAHDRPGSLVEVLQLFAAHGLNLTRIESRPTRRQLGTYVFFCDVQGHRRDPIVRGVLEEAVGITQWLRVLGSYPRWKRA